MVDPRPSLDSLLAGCEGVVGLEGDGDLRPTAVVEDSRDAVPGSLFVARPGSSDDGTRFLESAVERGATAVLVGAGAPVPGSVARRVAACVRAEDPAGLGSELAHRFHGSPAASLPVVAVTGTNGKTTVAWFVRALFAAAGRRCGLVGTIEVDDGATHTPAALTTPSSCDLAAMLARMVANDCDSVVLEASSHALHQRRLRGIRPQVAVFTNLSGDHLDYHGSTEAYAAAKASLFGMLAEDGCAVVNADDPAHRRMLEERPPRVVRCSLHDAAADARARILATDRTGMRLRFEGTCGEGEVHVPLVGRHNAENLLLALAALGALGLDPTPWLPALEHLDAPPGRLEPVTSPEDPFSVLVDYAHTDDALRNVLTAVRPLVPESGRLTVLFGCGGDRDRSKRPRMADVACSIADRVVVTSDNPRTESPEGIVEEILRGVPEGSRDRVTREVDRDRAIRRAVGEAIPGEIVVIAGKGHEDYQILGTRRRPFDDRLVARAALEDGGCRACPS